MSRAIWKKLFSDTCLLKKSVAKLIKIWSRSSVISEKFLEKVVLIHNGKSFKRLLIKREHIGFKFGEFILTKTHSQKQIKKKKK